MASIFFCVKFKQLCHNNFVGSVIFGQNSMAQFFPLQIFLAQQFQVFLLHHHFGQYVDIRIVLLDVHFFKVLFHSIHFHVVFQKLNLKERSIFTLLNLEDHRNGVMHRIIQNTYKLININIDCGHTIYLETESNEIFPFHFISSCLCRFCWNFLNPINRTNGRIFRLK